MGTGHLSLPITDEELTGGLLSSDGVRYSDLVDLYTAWSNMQFLPDDTRSIPYDLLRPS